MAEIEAAGNSQLPLAIERDDVVKLYSLIEEDKKLLDYGSEGPIPNTPLHDAADQGKTKVAMEIAILNPSFAQKLNRGGHSPMHLALQKKHYHTVRALMSLHPELIRVQGQGGITPLHFVAGEKGDNEEESKELLKLLAEFLFACKSSIEDLTNQCETVVHVAAKKHNCKALIVLFGWLKRVRMIEIMYWEDQDGNTVFDIVAPKVPQPEQQHKQQNLEQLELQNLEQLEQQNLEQPIEQQILEQLEFFRFSLLPGITEVGAKKEVLEFFRNLPKLLSLRGRGGEKKSVGLYLSELLSMKLTAFEVFSFWLGHQDESARNIILTVSTLIATATYQAALSPPGGYWQDNSPSPAANLTVVTANSSRIAVDKLHQAGNIILSGSKLYKFTALNSLVFLASTITIMITAISLLPRTIAVFLLMGFVGVSYYTTATIGFPKSEGVGARLTEGIYLSLQVVAFLVPLFLCMSYHNFRLRMEPTGRTVGYFLESKDGK